MSKLTKDLTARTAFIGNNLQQMTSLLIFLNENKFSVALKKTEKVPFNVNKSNIQYYSIVVPASQHNEIFEQGLGYCIDNGFDDIICGYPNLDFDLVKNIKERELGLGR